MRQELKAIEAEVDAVASAINKIVTLASERRGLSVSRLAEKFDLLLEQVCEEFYDDDLLLYSVVQTGATLKMRPGSRSPSEKSNMQREYADALAEYAASLEDDDPAATVGDYRADMMRGA